MTGKKRKFGNKYNNATYVISENSYSNLIKKGFKFSLAEESYIYKFVIKKWGKYPVLIGKIKVNEFLGEITVDVFKENGEFYAPFYSTQYGRYDPSLINSINKRIDTEFKKLGIVKSKKLKKEDTNEEKA